MQHRAEDAFMVPGMGAQPVPPAKYVADNDNRARLEDVCGSWLTGGQYIGLRRGRAGDPNMCADDLVIAPPTPTRHGDWMQTYTGRKFYPLDPRAEDVCIEDIAHSLSMQCRYAGHCRRFYSVAEHSVLMARWQLGQFGADVALWALLHDAAEAYLVDVPRPLKRHLAGYAGAELAVQNQICDHFGIPRLMPSEVHDADGRIIGDEVINLQPMDWHGKHNRPLGVPLMYWSPAEAEEEFMWTFRALWRQVKGGV